MKFYRMVLCLVGLPLASQAESPQTYPLATCVVSGEKLGSMGKTVVYTHEGREVRFCCRSCVKDFLKSPDKFLKKLESGGEKPKAP